MCTSYRPTETVKNIGISHFFFGGGGGGEGRVGIGGSRILMDGLNEVKMGVV